MKAFSVRTVITAVALACCAPGLCRGEAGQSYFGIGPTYSFLDPDTSADPALFVADDNDVGWRLFAGHDITNQWSVEGFFAMPGDAGIGPSGTIDYEAAFGLSGMFSWPDNGAGPGVFARAGASILETSSKNVAFSQENDAQISGGGGVRYGFRGGLSLAVEYDYLFSDVQLITLSLSKRFTVRRR